ncbi:conserved hypothetical protein [Sporisorium reilianum SRZ2]|uniref:Mig1 protein n=1 Tax=Sporisorium reilianum (strain SRZ2) TaxID=999809 RepID=E6ZNN8_SPORE|nr:conserved hypothetical protein [Sporisorium reilianum SRZ2]
MVSFKLFTLASALLLSSASVQAAMDIKEQKDMYDSYCSSGAKPKIGAICIDFPDDARDHIRTSSSGLVGYLDGEDHKRLAVPVGEDQATAWFTTLHHRIFLRSQYKERGSSNLCVQYTLTSFDSNGAPRKGVLCSGDAHLSV